MFGKTDYNGETFKIITPRDYECMYNTTVAIKAQLEKVGVKLELEVVNWATLLDTRNDTSKWDTMISSFSTVTDPTQYLIFDSTFAGWNEYEKTAQLIEKIRISSKPSDEYPYWKELQEHNMGETFTKRLNWCTYTLFTFTDSVVPWNVGRNSSLFGITL